MHEAFSLANLKPAAEDTATWGNGNIQLRICGYLSDQEPPLELVSSVRAIVFRDDTILVMRNLDSQHIVPGGRREDDETLEETLRREVLEESGLRLGSLTLLGFMHFHHLLPKPKDYTFPYPNFFQVVYLAEALEFVADAKLTDDYEQEAHFRSIAEVEKMNLTACERLYLEEALSVRRHSAADG